MSKVDGFPDPAPPGTPEEADPLPLVLIPVTAEEVARRQSRITLSWWITLLVLAAGASLAYKHAIDPVHAQESFDSGVRLLTVARYPQAILSFDRTIDLKPDFAEAYLMRGRAYVGYAQADRSIADFSKVIALRPGDTQALLARGEAYLALKDFQSAIADCNQAIDVAPQLAAAYNLRGMAVRAIGNPRQALNDFNNAVELAPNVDNYLQRGATYQMLDEHSRAIADFDQAIRLRPDGGPGYFARAESRRALGDLRGAEADHLQGRILDSR